MKHLLRLLPYLKRYKRTMIIGLTAVFLSNVFAVLIPLIIGNSIDQLRHGASSYSLFKYGFLVVSTTFLSGLFTFLTRQTIIVVSRKIEYDLRNDFYAHLQKLSYSFFTAMPTGDLMAHATNDISAVRNVLGPGIMYSTDTIIGFVIIIAIMISINIRLTLYALVPLPFVSLGVYFLGKLVNQKFEEVQAQYSALTARAQENISGIRVVKSYVRENFEIESFHALSTDYLKKNLSLAQIQSVIWPLMGILTGTATVIVLWRGGYDVIKGTLSLGTMVSFLIYLGLLTWPLIAFGWVVNIFQRGAASMLRLNRIFDTRPEISDTVQTNWSLNDLTGKIEFENVTFIYNHKKEPAIKGVNFCIEAGTTLAIVGKTGSGKTTLVNLIPRLLEPTEGKVYIDGMPINAIPLALLRRNIGYVQQETFLFSDTISNNIAYGLDHASKEEIEWAAEIAQIRKEVEEFPNKFSTIIGERGVTLSGGQKQRVAIARAVIRKPRILILDDALSAVDTYTEEAILKGLKKVMKERTSIIISHRISTVKDADIIIVLDEGKIAEVGTHGELVSNNGIYADLYYKQLLEEELERM